METKNFIDPYREILAQLNYVLLKRDSVDIDSIFNVIDNIELIFYSLYEAEYKWKKEVYI